MESVFTLGNISFDIISLVIIGIILISAIIGCIRGFLYSFLSFIRIFVMVGVGLLLAKPLAEWILTTSIGQDFVNSFTIGISGLNPAFSQPLTGANQLEQVYTILEMIKVPEVFLESLSELIVSLNQVEGKTIAQLVSEGLVNYLLILIAFFIIFLVIGLIFIFVLKVAKALNKTNVLGPINRILGLVINAVVAYVVIDVILCVFSYIGISNVTANEMLNQVLSLSNDSVISLAKFIYNNNITRYVLSTLI